MKAKNLMILGTASGVGKSVITAGFCRLFSDWGYRVAPFKAQNMSNNSYVTAEGGEMGRAQVVQAQCARQEPHVDMNPVLLKPAADNSSQVIVHGRSIGHFTARSYFEAKEIMWRAVCESYSRLAGAYDILVIEGAGSPAEVNLRENDFVNMRTAELADASCLLVGDIERGGIFASMIGTLDLLQPHERERIAGLVINKFRGDRSLFENGIDFLEERTGKKVWGMLPYDPDLWIEEEDAASLEIASSALWPSRNDVIASEAKQSRFLDIAVLHFPRISNFTDFEMLDKEPDVRVRYVRTVDQLSRPDLLILPGTKATVADYQFLSESGLRNAILQYAQAGGKILGICGGYQMMGDKILDPQGIETFAGEEIRGLGFFHMTTEFYPEKVLRRVEVPLNVEIFGGTVAGNIQAYEIHMGRTFHEESYAPLGEAGAIHPTGQLAGTYFHGLFESADFRKSFLHALRQSTGKKAPTLVPTGSASDLREENYERLARLLAGNLDLSLLGECLNLSLPSL